MVPASLRELALHGHVQRGEPVGCLGLEVREKLLNNFDQDVVEKVRIQSRDYLDRFEGRLWQLTRYLLASKSAVGDLNRGSVCLYQGRDVLSPGMARRAGWRESLALAGLRLLGGHWNHFRAATAIPRTGLDRHRAPLPSWHGMLEWARTEGR